MYLEQAVKIRIENLMKANGYSSLWELYRNSGVPKSTINALLGTDKNSLPRLPTLLHICEGLNITLKDFFNDDMFIDVIDNNEDKDG